MQQRRSGWSDAWLVVDPLAGMVQEIRSGDRDDRGQDETARKRGVSLGRSHRPRVRPRMSWPKRTMSGAAATRLRMGMGLGRRRRRKPELIRRRSVRPLMCWGSAQGRRQGRGWRRLGRGSSVRWVTRSTLVGRSARDGGATIGSVLPSPPSMWNRRSCTPRRGAGPCQRKRRRWRRSVGLGTVVRGADVGGGGQQPLSSEVTASCSPSTGEAR